MNVINTGASYEIYKENDINIYKELPPQTYKVFFNKDKGLYLEKVSDLETKEKMYGKMQTKIKKVFFTWEQFTRNLGIILSGEKGIGKSLFARALCEEGVKKYNLPVIIVDHDYEGIANFIENIHQECIVLFDEFEKNFHTDPSADDIISEPRSQSRLLSLFDGINNDKKMFIITCNYIDRLNKFLMDRPGRFHYHFKFVYPTIEESKQYLKDKIKTQKLYDKYINEIIFFLSRKKVSYDSLRSIAFELNNGFSFYETLEDLNIMNLKDEPFEIKITMSDGKVISDVVGVNFYSDLNPIHFSSYFNPYWEIQYKIPKDKLVYNEDLDEFTIDCNDLILHNDLNYIESEYEDDRYAKEIGEYLKKNHAIDFSMKKYVREKKGFGFSETNL